MIRTSVKRIFVMLLVMLAFIPDLLAQVQVKGTVKDSAGEPLIGASVLEKNTTNGTITDMDGNFELSVKNGATLVISYIGYISKELKATSVMNVTLSDDSKLLDDVVVVGYGVQKKSSVTGSISQVKAGDIENRTITSAAEALEGKTAGVQLVSTSSQPGSSPSVRVRGFASNGTSEPLYIIDGLIADDLSNLDPNNVEKMEVLKDAASAAIYGAQAGNGVVLITTKTGSKGKTNIKFDLQYTSQSLGHHPALINSQEALSQTKDMDPSFTDENIQQLIDDGTWDGKSTTDWFDVAFGHSNMTHATVTVDGGSDKGNFLLSLSNLYNNGIIREDRDTYRRFSTMLNADYNVKKWLKVGIKANFNKYTSRSVDDGSSNDVYEGMISRIMTLKPYFADTYSPNALPLDMQSQLNSGFRLFTNANGDYYSTLGVGDDIHPMVAIRRNDPKNYGTNLSGTMFANLTPFKGFTFTSRLGYNIASDDTYKYTDLYYASGSDYNKENNDVTRTHASTLYYQWENFFNYNFQIAEKHDLTFMGGMSFSERRYTYMLAEVDKIAQNDDAYKDVSYGASDATKTVGGYQKYYRKLSYFGRLSYNYQDRYMLEGVLRADAADLSILPKESRWGYFPSVSAGWAISNEEFFKNWDQNALTYLKLRASWGVNGSTSNLSNYLYSNSISTNSAGYSYSNKNIVYTSAAYPSQIANLDLKWETSHQIDLGLDVRALNDRFTFGMDWYRKTTKDLIVSDFVIPYEVGNNSAPKNAGDVLNTGFEFDLGWRDNVSKDFSYSISANLATLHNEVTYLDPSIANGRMEGNSTLGNGDAFTAFELGHPVWYFRGYQVDHLDENGAPVFRDNDNNGIIDGNDKAEIGKPMPDFTYGVTLGLQYKNFDLTVFGSGSVGNDVFMCYSYTPQIYYSLKEMYDNRWTPENTSAKFAAPSLNNTDKYMLSDAYVFSASYFKIKQIQLGYKFPTSLTKKLSLQSFRLYASLDDFFVFTNYPGLDPDVSATSTSGMGVDYGKYPTTKKVVLGLSVVF